MPEQLLPYNPLDKMNLGGSVAAALIRRPVVPLPPEAGFSGAGIYAIYYLGPFPIYEPIRERNAGGRFEQPIYVGKAVPPGARKGERLGLGLPAGPALFNRLSQHARSIESVDALAVSDFHCRYLVVEDIWIPLGETLLIARYRPLWNLVVEGFGNHDPGGGRSRQQCSRWDTLHPGRSWAAKLEPNQSPAEEIERLARDFLAGKEVPTIAPEDAAAEE
ncbi:MAG: Eco29kI family restriction endonuclease [Terriglobales bacterium]